MRGMSASETGVKEEGEAEGMQGGEKRHTI